MNLNVRKGDNVKVLTGKDKGKTGKVLAADPKSGRVLVEGVNIATHHHKARQAGEQSGKKKVEAPIDVSNVQIICPACGKNARVRHSEVDGKNARMCAKCGANLDAALKADKSKKKADKDKKPKKKAADKVQEPIEAADTANVAEDSVAAEKPAKKPSAKKAPAKKTEKEVPVASEADGKTSKE